MGLIRIENFKKSFGKKIVHAGINLQIHEGECLGLIGGSGSGKSVLLRSLIGLERPDEGKVFYQGIEVSKLKETSLTPVRKEIAYVFQGGALFDSMSVFDNLAYPLREHTKMSEKEIAERIRNQLNDFGLAGNEAVSPAQLSGGMQKRVGLARSIILGPKVILYDEPTAGLDPFNTHKIEDMILSLKSKGTTSVLVTHDMPVAFSVCDRIAMLLNGVIHSVNTVAEIKKDSSHVIQKFAVGEFQ